MHAVSLVAFASCLSSVRFADVNLAALAVSSSRDLERPMDAFFHQLLVYIPVCTLILCPSFLLSPDFDEISSLRYVVLRPDDILEMICSLPSS